EEGQFEPVGVDLPGDDGVLGISGSAAGHDGDVIEPVGLTPRLEDTDLDLSHPVDLRLRYRPALGAGAPTTVSVEPTLRTAKPSPPYRLGPTDPLRCGIGPGRAGRGSALGHVGEERGQGVFDLHRRGHVELHEL